MALTAMHSSYERSSKFEVCTVIKQELLNYSLANDCSLRFDELNEPHVGIDTLWRVEIPSSDDMTISIILGIRCDMNIL